MEQIRDKKQQMLMNAPKCYQCDNNFAYYYDLWKSNKSDKTFALVERDLKVYNFVPTYDKWCLACGNKSGVSTRCDTCKSVFFCNAECQKAALAIHENHCKRNLFILCCTCGSSSSSPSPSSSSSSSPLTHKCAQCPVQFCSQACYDQIYAMHKLYDCDYFTKTFN